MHAHAEGGHQGAAAEEAARKAAAAAAWRAKLAVLDPVVHVGTCRAQRTALDRLHTMLADAPAKRSLKDAHLRAFDHPLSMFLGDGKYSMGTAMAGSLEPLAQAGTAQELEQGACAGVKHGHAFATALRKQPCALHKPGSDQSWYGSMHDVHLQP